MFIVPLFLFEEVIMPYDALSELPDAVQKMPKHAQEIYQKAFKGREENPDNY